MNMEFRNFITPYTLAIGALYFEYIIAGWKVQISCRAAVATFYPIFINAR